MPAFLSGSPSKTNAIWSFSTFSSNPAAHQQLSFGRQIGYALQYKQRGSFTSGGGQCPLAACTFAAANDCNVCSRNSGVSSTGTRRLSSA